MGSAQAAQTGFDDDNEGIDSAGSTAPKVLDARFHVEQQRLVTVEQEMGDQSFQQGIFGAETTCTPTAHRAQAEQTNPVLPDTEGVRNVINLGIKLEPTADRAGLGSRAFIDQRLHLGDRLEFSIQLGRQTERQAEVTGWVSINCNHVLASSGIDV